MQVLFVFGLEFALSKSDELAPREITRIGLQDDMTFIGSASALNRSWNVIEGTLADAGHRLRDSQCGVSLQNIERFACDQHDHVSFAKAWVLKSRGGAHVLDYDFRLVSPAVVAPLQRRMEGTLRQTISVLLGSAVSELAWERGKLTTCFGGLGIRVAQMSYAAPGNVPVGC